MTKATKTACNQLARQMETALLEGKADVYSDLQAQMAALLSAARR